MTQSRTLQEIMKTNMLVRHKAGSHAYGTNIETSDIDIRGIFCADPINIRTPFFTVKEAEIEDEDDTKFYELANYMKLTLLCNPNVIETLWVDKSDILESTPAYDLLRSHRESFLSSKIAFTTSGYALAQLKRIKGHNKWINSPQPEQQPRPCEYLSVVQWLGKDKNLHVVLTNFKDNHRFIPFGNDMFGIVGAPGFQLWDDDGNLNDNFDGDRAKYNNTYLMVVKWNRDEFKTRLEKWAQYWTWKKNRNEIRSTLEENHGYDTKHAMHLVRLLRMGKEALQTGQIIVKRPDAKELLEIRNGAWTYNDIVKYAEEMDEEIQKKWYVNTPLPKHPDLNHAAKVLMEVQDIVWRT